jgi:hypothetical protein
MLPTLDDITSGTADMMTGMRKPCLQPSSIRYSERETWS